MIWGVPLFQETAIWVVIGCYYVANCKLFDDVNWVWITLALVFLSHGGGGSGMEEIRRSHYYVPLFRNESAVWFNVWSQHAILYHLSIHILS